MTSDRVIGWLRTYGAREETPALRRLLRITAVYVAIASAQWAGVLMDSRGLSLIATVALYVWCVTVLVQSLLRIARALLRKVDPVLGCFVPSTPYQQAPAESDDR